MTDAILLTLAGFVLMVMEIFFISFGALAVASALCIVAADVIAYRVSPVFMGVLIALQVVAIPLLLKGALALLPRLPFGRGMLLNVPTPQPGAGVAPATHLLGREALALTELRPGGFALVGDERLSVVLESGLAAPGTRLIVSSVEGVRIVVRPADAATPSPSSGASA